MRAFKVALVLVATLVLAACAQTDMRVNKGFAAAQGPHKLLLMKPDIEVSLLTAGGLNQPNQEWTEQARSGVLAALEANASQRGGTLLKFNAFDSTPEQQQINNDLENLNRAVSVSIALHEYAGAPLPTKKGKFEWSLGENARKLGEQTGADYALFIFARDSFSSGGRVAMQLLLAAAGVGIQGGQQFAYASLVNLKSGDVLWFNLYASQSGDIRTPEGAASLVNSLLKTMPLGTQPTAKK
jgi:hypothetical protein